MYEYLKDKTVLYIEDDIDVLKNISTLLQNYFSDIYAVPNAEAGFEVFLNASVDLLLVDIELPGINGIELIKKVREVDKDIPIVIISAYTKTDYLLESVELKIDKYIVKPFTTKKLYTLLDKLNEIFQDEDIIELLDGLKINSKDSTLYFKEELHHLTPRELHFLQLLHVKQFVHYETIDALWEDTPPTEAAVRSFVKSLRKKLPQDTLKNRQNLGYYV